MASLSAEPVLVSLVIPAYNHARYRDQAIRSVCAELAVPEAELREGRRTRAASRARALVCQRAVHDLGLHVTEVARALGLSHAAVSQALRRADARK